MVNVDAIKEKSDSIDFTAVAAKMVGEKLTDDQKKEISKVKEVYDEVKGLKSR